jgi:hypothetical protein
MKQYLALALLGLGLASGTTQSKAEGCCIEVPKACYPILRIPAEEYVYSPAVFYPPDRPVPYSVWYYAFYQPFCADKPKADCIWACGRVPR